MRGTKPGSCKGLSAVPLEDKILILKKGSKPDDQIWFLEVGVSRTKSLAYSYFNRILLMHGNTNRSKFLIIAQYKLNVSICYWQVDTQYVRQQQEYLGTEVVAWSKGVVGKAEKPVVISGPSGVGKGTLISMLMKEFPSMFGFSVSHTTRAPRGMEKDGVHYHFTEKSIMEKEIKEGKFLEFASVHGNLYGTSVEAVELVADAGKVSFLCLTIIMTHLFGTFVIVVLFPCCKIVVL